MPHHALVTGGAGFIGSHLVDRLLADGCRVTAIDSFDPFYPALVKRSNIEGHLGHPAYKLIEGDINDPAVLKKAADPNAPFTVLVHLAAKAGVRPSMEDPLGYHRVNVTGTLAMLEFARMAGIPHFVLASSSSIYGEDTDVPWSEDVPRDAPISLYAATKLQAEAYAGWYSRIHGMKVTALRFFTVYGPRQRPDLAIHHFVDRIGRGLAITQFGDGGTQRDYTFIEDIINGVVAALNRAAGERFEIYNLGNSEPVALRELVACIESAMGMKALISIQPIPPGDVPRTMADIAKAQRDLGYAPTTDIKGGLQRFVEWYRRQPVRA